MSTFITVIGGIIFLKKTEKLWQKIIMSILVIIGVLLIGRLINIF